MTATREITFEQIAQLRKQIDEATGRGEDVSVLKEQLAILTETWSQQLANETSSKSVLKG